MQGKAVLIVQHGHWIINIFYHMIRKRIVYFNLEDLSIQFCLAVITRSHPIIEIVIPFLPSCGGVWNGCEDPAYFWKVISRSFSGVSMVDAARWFVSSDSTSRILFMLMDGLECLTPPYHRWPICGNISRVLGTMLGCIRHVFNWSLKRCFGTPHNHLPLKSSSNRMIRGRRMWRPLDVPRPILFI